MKTLLFKSIAVLGLTAVALTAHAGQMDGAKGIDMGGMKMDMAEGVVEAIDPAGKEIMLKHGPIKSKTVEMSPMTMMFAVQKTSLLTKVNVGDKVKFNVENIKGTATITALKVQK